MATPWAAGWQNECFVNSVTIIEMQSRPVKIILIIILGAIVLTKAILPPFTHVDTDFPNYYVASRILIDHGDASQVYNDTFFSAQAVSMGLAAFSRFTPFPPATIFVMLPFAWLPPMSALQWWTVFNLFILGVVISLMTNITRRTVLWCATLVLASGHALINNFKFGQFYLVLLLCCVMIYRGMQTNKHFAAGVMLGFGAAIKYFPALYLIPLVARKQWKTIAWGVGTASVLFVVGWMVVGSAAQWGWMTSSLVQHANGDITGQSSNSALFESWNALLRRLFVHDLPTNPTPMVDWPPAYTIGIVVIYAMIATTTIIAWRKLQAIDRKQSLPLQWSLLSFAAFTILPISATYHVLLLILPVGLMLQSEGRWSMPQKIIAAAYVVIAFFPYAQVNQYESRGALSVLAFPRLYLLCVLFGATVKIITSRPRPVPPMSSR